MNGKKRLAALVAVCAAMLGMLNGCVEEKSENIALYDRKDMSAEEEIRISMMGYKADALNLVAIEDTLHGFMEENPGINISYEGLKGSTYWDALEKRKQWDVLDDIIMVDQTRVLEMKEAGLLADLSDLPGLDQFNDMAVSQFTEEDGSVYFLPTCIATYGMYINYDLLEAHGQPIPTNWEEFAQVCDYFVGQGITPIVGNNYTTLRTLMSGRGLYSFYQQEDTAALVEQVNRGEGDLAQRLRPGIEMVAEMLERGWFDKEELRQTNQTSDDLVLFAKGDRPFMMTGGWASPRVSALEPNFSFGIYPYPIMEDGSVLVMDVNTCVAVNAKSEYVDICKDFIAYIIQPDIIWEYCESQSSYTPLKDDRVPSDEAIAASVDYLTNGRSVIGSDYKINIPLDVYLNVCGDGLLSGLSAEEAVTLLESLLRGG